MTWQTPLARTTNHDAIPSRLTCDATVPRYVGETLRRRGTRPCTASLVGFPNLLEARDVALENGWEVANAGDRCPSHRGRR